MSADPRVIVALDFPDAEGALALAQRLDPRQCRVKIGKELYTAAGPSLVEQLQHAGFGVFLDLKFHDIPNTVTKAALEAAKLGVSMMTIHASGGRAMMSAVSGEIRERFGADRPLVVAVTVLTSINSAALQESGVARSMEEQVRELALLARDSGIDGVVCSPKEITLIRSATGADFTIVTPGIRMCGQSLNDQERAATPREAIARGADYLVVGRAVTGDANPRQALERLIQSM
jgi:orotidine-5'-phosphate decarboxylase